MLNADDILTPHTPEKVHEIEQKRLDEFEKLFPGVYEKIREWMQGDDFASMYTIISPSAEKIGDGVMVGAAPMSMKVSIACMASVSINYNDEYYDLISWLAEYLWKLSGLARQFILFNIPLATQQSAIGALSERVADEFS